MCWRGGKEERRTHILARIKKKKDKMGKEKKEKEEKRV